MRRAAARPGQVWLFYAIGLALVGDQSNERRRASERNGQGGLTLRGRSLGLHGDRVVACPMPADRSISIDDFEDWAAAERALARRQP